MFDSRTCVAASTASEPPRDLPMPAYRYQQEQAASHSNLSDSGAAAIQNEYRFLGCAAARPLEP